MTFVDYLTLMLVNMSAGLILLAGYLIWGLSRPDHQKSWAAPFFMVGLVAVGAGGHMALTWPIAHPPGHAYNAAFGEMTVLLGVLFLGAALSLARGWSLGGVAAYGVVAGLIATLVGGLIYVHQMTAMPALTCAGYALSGLGGALVAAALAARQNRPLRYVVAAVLLAAAAIWLFTAAMAYAGHFANPNWLPPKS